ncbi:MAG: TIGR00730 family Rossman fold protein [Pseudomonadota bacterium]
MTTPPLKSICLYCGSRAGTDPAYTQDAETMGRLMAEAGYRLVFGAGEIGLMGVTARAVEAAGGRVLGFVPGHIVKMEVADTSRETVIVTETMHERKKLMFSNADAILALPGGPGTLDELIEVLTWRQLGLHEKPVVLLNTAGYWDPLLALFAHIERQGFCGSTFGGFLTVVETPEAAMETFRSAFE